MFEYENKCKTENLHIICGIDEAGRGPLAGPVVAAAVIPCLKKLVDGVNDSKKLTAKRREELYLRLKETVLAAEVCACDVDIIEEINILGATKKAMTNAVNALKTTPDAVLIDAVKLNLKHKTYSIIKGDAVSYCIAAASIIAKVERDNMMLKYAKIYPEYGFESHKGYGTAHHIEMIKKYGPCPIHRLSFLQNILQEGFKI
jgi:ribonuclease HII